MLIRSLLSRSMRWSRVCYQITPRRVGEIIPKEHIDQKWLSSILCVMYRAMQRELRLLATFGVGEPQPMREDRLHCVAAGAKMCS